MKIKRKASVFRIVCTVLLVTVLLIGVGLFIAYRAISSMGLGADGVAGYDTRIVIWENAAGNSSRSKLDDMNIDERGNKLLATISFALAIVNRESNSLRIINPYINQQQLQLEHFILEQLLFCSFFTLLLFILSGIIVITHWGGDHFG